MDEVESQGRGAGRRAVGARLAVAGFIVAVIAVAAIAAWPGSGSTATPTGPVHATGTLGESAFVQRSGAGLAIDGRPFRFAGANNYYLMYSSRRMVDDVLSTAVANGFTVVRTWGWLETPKDGVVFQTWNGSAIVYNDGETGLQHLDYVVAQAGKLGLRLVIPFTNNWSDFGGMDAYVQWAGDSTHDSFYTDPKIRQWFENWISHLLNHVNSINGLAYKDDPTIMAWELANEPSCSGGGLPRSAGCTTATITDWAAEMSTYAKSIDARHLVDSGSTGFFDETGSTDFTRDGSDGVDELALSKLPNIDLLSYHLYPDSWSKDPAWATAWIVEHTDLAKQVGKPSMLGEYSWKDGATRAATYQSWANTVFTSGGTGALVWLLSGKQDDGSPYPDYDGFTVYCPSATCTTLGDIARAMPAPAASGS